jgi:hypothetical protein
MPIIEPAKPEMTYKSPLQRMGPAWEAPQTRSTPLSPAVETAEYINYSYKLVPGGGNSNHYTRNKKISIVNNGLLSTISRNPRTRAPFKPQKAGRGTSSWQLKQYAEATLGSGSLRKAVKLPEGEDKDEWLAVNGGYPQGPHSVGFVTKPAIQWSISTTKSTSSTAPSPNSARRNRAPK